MTDWLTLWMTKKMDRGRSSSYIFWIRSFRIRMHSWMRGSLE